jgi:ferric-dicitrate binding protein FerR (iron transport regulator)
MTLHPDVLTDLVILYHAGEASQASRELLENEARQNPSIAAALSARPRAMQPLEAAPRIPEREVLKRIRRHYLIRAILAIGLFLVFLVLFVRLLMPGLSSSNIRGDAPPDTTKTAPERR